MRARESAPRRETGTRTTGQPGTAAAAAPVPGSPEDDLPPWKITLHSPLDCPGCGSRFDGTWTPDSQTAAQACPSCARVFTATWQGWTFTPEQTVITREELSPARLPG